jgi:hypothetical protein
MLPKGFEDSVSFSYDPLPTKKSDIGSYIEFGLVPKFGDFYSGLLIASNGHFISLNLGLS